MSDVKKIALITSTSNFERHKNTIKAVHQTLQEMGEYALFVLTCYGLFDAEGVITRLYDKGEASIYTLLDETTFDGCIVEGNVGNHLVVQNIVDKIQRKNIPLVIVNFGVKDVPSVVLDGYDAACQMVTHLIEVHHCTKINLVPTTNRDSIVGDSVRGYRDTLEKYGIPVEEKRILYRQVGIPQGRELWEDFKQNGSDDAEAVVCIHDVHSIGLCQELKAQGKRIPEDILVCSLNRSTNSVAFRPDISGVDRMDRKIARKACELLEDLMNGKMVPKVNLSHGEIYFGRSCGCPNMHEDESENEFQQLVLAKIEVGNQIRQMMSYNDSLDSVDSLEELLQNLQGMYRGLDCPQYILCMNEGAIKYASSDKDYTFPQNGKLFDDEMHAVVGYTEQDGELKDVTFPIGKLIPMEVKAGDMVLLYPVHNMEKVYGYVAFLNDYLPVDLYNYRICHESIASSMDNLHRQMVLRKSIDMLDQLHMHDALTGLYNRYAWLRFSEDYTDKDAYCVVFMDMDGLKKINDVHGHDAGNVALRITAEAIKKSAHENDLVTRCGGDEFQVLSTCVDIHFWENLQKVINDEIDRQIAEQKLPYVFGISYGYCISDKKNQLTFEECCDKADTLMYANKKIRKAERVN